eukprot:GHVT01049003.1.p1 GENE.GHVT01049003.1~~GHVT01049003.1.p1  ORF type:complete len:1030 (-),score=271.52 GHVT01049003.1:393-3200(-)
MDLNEPKANAVAVDVTLHHASSLFGFSEHATALDLPDFSEPYRFYNLDVFEYDLDSPMALYGSVPFLLALHDHPKEHRRHGFSADDAPPPTDSGGAKGSDSSGNGAGRTVASGFLWTNPSETWVKLDRANQKGVSSWWASESGPMNFFVFVGPTAADVYRQYHLVTGQAAFPPLFALGKHQCRWNYNDEADVRQVDSSFDAHDIPYDVIWLDIEHTDEKKYFTWNASKFPNPKQLLKDLDDKRRKMVTIVDPHLKLDPTYYVYAQAKQKNLLVQQADGSNEFSGHCWAGKSTYPDFLNPKTRAWWASLFAYETYEGSAPNLFVWNDMNEPSVFSGPELTMPKNLLHHQGVLHRDVHNLYGMLYHGATVNGLVQRSKSATCAASSSSSSSADSSTLFPFEVDACPLTARPFVLSRAFFVGSHRLGFFWTGDNKAVWEHLEAATPMILSAALSGLSAIGADVGGFFGDPTPELLTRWHQVGAWYPFDRSHAHIDTKRREPWLFGDDVLRRIRDAIALRYKMIPLWYTLFAEYAGLGIPIITPLWWACPTGGSSLPLSSPASSSSSSSSSSSGLLSPSGCCSAGCRSIPLSDMRRRYDAFLVGGSIFVQGVYKPLDQFPPIPSGPGAGEEGRKAPGGDGGQEGAAKTDESDRFMSIFLPSCAGPTALGPSTWWYNLHSGQRVPGGVKLNQRLTLEEAPVYVKHGTILFNKFRKRRNTSLMMADPYTLLVYVCRGLSCLWESSSSSVSFFSASSSSAASSASTSFATGRIFVDDGATFSYRAGDYLYRTAVFHDGRLRLRAGRLPLHPPAGDRRGETAAAATAAETKRREAERGEGKLAEAERQGRGWCDAFSCRPPAVPFPQRNNVNLQIERLLFVGLQKVPAAAVLIDAGGIETPLEVRPRLGHSLTDGGNQQVEVKIGTQTVVSIADTSWTIKLVD